MPTQVAVYQEIVTQMQRCLPDVPAASQTRLSLLVTGLLRGQTTRLARVADRLFRLGVTAATCGESVERRLRRTLNDGHLTAARCYEPVLAQVIDWTAARVGDGPLVLIVDESSKRDEVHLLRVSLAYRGGAVPLAWAVWAQNVAQAEGHYWQQVDTVLARVAARLPAGVPVVVTADRAYAVANFIDRIAAHGWHWIVRVTTTGEHRFRDSQGREHRLADLVRRHLPGPGQRWKARGAVCKDAGWRAASVVGYWARGEREPLVVLSDLAPRWSVVAQYGRRFWTEPGFRSDKRQGWDWEASQVQGVAHHERLLLGMAWATMLTLCVGAAEAASQLQRLAARPPQRRRTGLRVGRPQHARQSLFTLGLRALEPWFAPVAALALPWTLPAITAPSWDTTWRQAQARRYLAFHFCPVRP